MGWFSPQENRVLLNHSLTKDDKGHVNQVTLAIHKVSKQDEGEYTCKVSEGSGLEEANIYHLKLSGECALIVS